MTEWKMLNGMCVPVDTPDNYKELADLKWLEKQRAIRDACAELQKAHDLYVSVCGNPIEPEHYH